MLIDISDILGINVFVLGSVFLQLCRVLRLEAHPMFSRYIQLRYLVCCDSLGGLHLAVLCCAARRCTAWILLPPLGTPVLQTDT